VQRMFRNKEKKASIEKTEREGFPNGKEEKKWCQPFLNDRSGIWIPGLPIEMGKDLKKGERRGQKKREGLVSNWAAVFKAEGESCIQKKAAFSKGGAWTLY